MILPTILAPVTLRVLTQKTVTEVNDNTGMNGLLGWEAKERNWTKMHTR